MNLEERYIYEGRVVFDNFADLNYVRSLFHFVEFNCLLEINEQICPRFILEFYSQFQLNYFDKGQMFVEFVIQNQLFSYSFETFAQILDVPGKGACVFKASTTSRPLNPQPLQSLPSLDITLSLSPITPLENLSNPPSPSPPPPPPQPLVIGHPLYYNYHDCHGSTCICCFHNRNLHLNLRDEMNIMFAHLEYLLTTAFTTHFPPQP
ncbi:hypothetical protein Tco_0559374 [Tanacetum coccineum]